MPSEVIFLYGITALIIDLLAVLFPSPRKRLMRCKIWKRVIFFILSPLLALQEAIIIAYEVWSRRKTR